MGDMTNEVQGLIKAHNLTTANAIRLINRVMDIYKQMEPEYIKEGLPEAKVELVEGLEPLLSYLNSSASDEGLQKRPAELGFYYDIRIHEIKHIEDDEKRNKDNTKKT